MSMPLDKQVELEAQLLAILRQAEYDWHVKITNISASRACTAQGWRITEIDLEITDPQQEPRP